MASKQQIGGLFMVGLPGPELDDSTRRLIGEGGIGNFILFKRNVQSSGQLAALCGDLRRACLDAGLGAPLIAIDQEGGTVARLPPPFVQFPDARVYGEGPDPEAAVVEFASRCAAELLRLGINMNLAPVLDVCPADQGFFMERRALHGEPERAAELGRLIIETMQSAGVAACGKHFPGLGGARLDPHRVLPVVERGLAELEEDLVPFRAAIAAGVGSVMTSHTIYPALDPELPATLSPSILTGLLREKLGFDGVIVTDDLEMGAIENHGSVAEASRAAFAAGADLLLICHEHHKVVAAREMLAASFNDGDFSAERLDRSLRRIHSLRARFA